MVPLPWQTHLSCHFPQEPLPFHIKEVVAGGIFHLHMKVSLIHSGSQGGLFYCFLLLLAHCYLCLLWLLYYTVHATDCLTNRFYCVSGKKKSSKHQEMAGVDSAFVFPFHSGLIKAITCMTVLDCNCVTGCRNRPWLRGKARASTICAALEV